MMQTSLVVLAAVLPSTIFAISTTAASGFTANDRSLSFALNIPNDKDDPANLYMAISGRSSSSWIAIGMGNNEMKNTLMILVYTDSGGQNVTVSPRLSYGYVEPSYDTNITYSVASGSGISNGTMTARIMCSNCRSWKGGLIDPIDTAANFVFASGPDGKIDSKSASAGIKRHASYGAFTMDLIKAVGAGRFPDSITADTSGTVQNNDKTDHDFYAPLHACLMILSFLVLMLIGVMILRIMDTIKWHGFNQSFSAAVALLGVFLGLYCGTMYNRSKNFNTAHQLFGILITIAMVAQFILGFVHHRIYKKRLSTTKLAPVHVWLGRLVIPSGVANGFLGFPLALNPKYNWVLVGLILLVVVVLVSIFFWNFRRGILQRQTTGAVGSDSDTANLSDAWRTVSTSQNDINLSQMNIPPHYESSHLE